MVKVEDSFSDAVGNEPSGWVADGREREVGSVKTGGGDGRSVRRTRAGGRLGPERGGWVPLLVRWTRRKSSPAPSYSQLKRERLKMRRKRSTWEAGGHGIRDPGSVIILRPQEEGWVPVGRGMGWIWCQEAQGIL